MKQRTEIEKLKKEKYSHLKDWDDKVIELAISLHNTYEVFSMEEGWKTQDKTHLKAFRDLPMENQRVMLRLAAVLINKEDEDIKQGIQKAIDIINLMDEYLLMTKKGEYGISKKEVLEKLNQELGE